MAPTGENIRIQRQIRNYSQAGMAYELGISQAAYSKMERDETEITIRRVFEVAEILEISPFLLMPKPKSGSAINLDSIIRILRKLKKYVWTKFLETTSQDPILAIKVTDRNSSSGKLQA
ncbi:hypothetical protein GCM10023149_37340 [Mucilaginibacter gynuensis]|uniref:HTH cro/C1-type domain-containing protein n=1 Tax=Mucilaginibacter gynuensis TaxID=1302236 RepID=A0ABP8GYT4_9SPHI